MTVTDAEDGTISGTAPDCARVEVNYLLGHDSHGHPLTGATGCQGVIQTTGDGGHGTDANIFGVLAAGYTDKGGAPGAGPLKAEREIKLWPKLLQAEHYTEMRGIQVVAQADAGGGERVGYTDDAGGTEQVNYIAWDPVNLVNISSLTITASSGGRGGPIQVRLDDPASGPLLGTVNVPNTGSRGRPSSDFDLPITPPAGTPQAVPRVPERRARRRPDPLQRQGHRAERQADGERGGDADRGRRAAPGPVHRHRDRPRRRGADVRVGLRRRHARRRRPRTRRTPTRSPAPTRRRSPSRTPAT